MHHLLRIALALGTLACALQASAQATLFARDDFRGPSLTAQQSTGSLERDGLRELAASVVLDEGWWELCEAADFRGRCVLARQGRYPTLASLGLNDRIASVRRVASPGRDNTAPARAAASSITLFEHDAFAGNAFSSSDALADFNRQGFNDKASSVVVEGGSWEICEDVYFRGRCVVLKPGRYASLGAIGLNDRISSLRRADGPTAGTPPAPAPAAEITFYDNEGFGGQTFKTQEAVRNFKREGFNDRASAALVTGSAWEVCSNADFGGRCATLQPGQYASLASLGLGDNISSARKLEPDARYGQTGAVPQAAAPSALFYEREDFRGRVLTVGAAAAALDLERAALQGRARSVDVGTGRWEVCEEPGFGGRCMQLQQGRYPSVASMGLRNAVASTRAVGADGLALDGDRRAPGQGAYDARRRGGERLYLVKVTSVREVSGTAEQRCWTERQPAAEPSSSHNVPGALAGAVIGGILGHQVGGGTGKDIATIGGVLAGAVVGSRVGRGGEQAVPTQDVQRCSPAAGQASPSYWEVTYTFRGVEHRVQMNAPPHSTLTVNEQGEPRA